VERDETVGDRMAEGLSAVVRNVHSLAITYASVGRGRIYRGMGAITPQTIKCCGFYSAFALLAMRSAAL